MKSWKSSANANAMASGAKFFAFGIVALVAIYGDIMFLQLMWSTFPDGIGKIFSAIGAVATALSIIILLVGKRHWFRPGGQLTAAYAFTVIEFVVLVANTLVAFNLHNGGHLDSYLAMWYYFCAATPFVSAAGWILILQLDKEQQQRHEDMELADQMEQAERAHRLTAHQMQMQLKRAFLEHQAAYLAEEVNSPQMQAGIREAARRMAQENLKGLSGFPIAPGLHSPTVDSTARAISDNEIKAYLGESEAMRQRVHDLKESQRQQSSPAQPAPQAPKDGSPVLGALKAFLSPNPQPGDAQDTGPLAIPPLNSQANQSNGTTTGQK